jgi:hypothetical protein
MEDWHDLISLITEIFPFALVFGLAVSVFAYLVIRLVHLRPKIRNLHQWRSDLRPAVIVGGIFFLVVFIPGVFIGYLFSGGCGTGDITEIPSPDNQHKIVVYNFDCGATTDFSLDVSLLKTNEKLPKHHAAKLIYHRYHQYPTATGPQKNFDVSWKGPKEVVVQVGRSRGSEHPHPTRRSDNQNRATALMP